MFDKKAKQIINIMEDEIETLETLKEIYHKRVLDSFDNPDAQKNYSIDHLIFANMFDELVKIRKIIKDETGL